MTNPQLTRNLLEVIRSLPVSDRRWLLEQLGQDSGELGSDELAQMAMTGQAFDDLALEPDLYSFSDGEPVAAGSYRLALKSSWWRFPSRMGPTSTPARRW